MSASDDLIRDDDEREAVRRLRARKTERSREDADRAAKDYERDTSVSRFKKVVTGEEKPTRESNAEYRKRKAREDLGL
jgi:hypothetical protein